MLQQKVCYLTYPGDVTLLSQQFQNAPRRFFYQLQAVCVVRKLDMRKFYFLLTVLKLEK